MEGKSLTGGNRDGAEQNRLVMGPSWLLRPPLTAGTPPGFLLLGARYQKAKREGTAQLGEKKAQGGLTNVYKYLKGGCKEDGARLFPVVPSDRTRGNGHTLKHKKCCLNVRKHCLTMRVVLWNKLPRETVESPSLEIFKT